MDDTNRLNNLDTQHQHVEIKKGYSWFVKSMRLILPLIAIGLIFIVITLPKVKEDLTVMPKSELVEKPTNEIGENELLKPHFETIDANKNPVYVTAIKALQNQDNPNLIKLEEPKAKLKMKNGAGVKIKALKGSYEQETEKLFLQDNVLIEHASGYQLQAEELRVDMKTREAFSDKTVYIDGPAAKIEAVGLKGNVDDGTLIFNGPIRLTLKPTPIKEKKEM